MTVEALVIHFKHKKFSNGLSWEYQENLSLNSNVFSPIDYTLKMSNKPLIDDTWIKISKKINKLDLSETNLWNIDSNVFTASPLVELKLPSTIKRLGVACFLNSRLESLDIFDTEIETIYAFTFFSSEIKKLKLPRYIENIKKAAFYNSNLENIDFGEYIMLEKIDSYAFGSTNENKAHYDDIILDISDNAFKKTTTLPKGMYRYLEQSKLREEDINFGRKKINVTKKEKTKINNLISPFEVKETIVLGSKNINQRIEPLTESFKNSLFSHSEKKQRNRQINANGIQKFIENINGESILNLSSLIDFDFVSNSNNGNEIVHVDKIKLSNNSSFSISPWIEIKMSNINGSDFYTEEQFSQIISCVDKSNIKFFKFNNETFNWLVDKNNIFNNKFLKSTEYWSIYDRIEILDLSDVEITNWDYSLLFSNLRINEVIMPKTLRKMSSFSFWMTKINVINLEKCENLQIIEKDAFSRCDVKEVKLPLKNNIKIVR